MAPNSSQLDCAQRLTASKLYSEINRLGLIAKEQSAQRLPASKLYSDGTTRDRRNPFRCSTPTGIKVIFRMELLPQL